MIAIRRVLLSGGAWLAGCLAAHGSVWVSPDGLDSNEGTEERPVRTLERARDLVRAENRNMSDDITVFISGFYRIARPLELGPEDEGTNGYSVVYTAAPGAHPVICGAAQVTGWVLADRSRNLWSAPAPEGLVATRNLFVNGAPAERTRIRLVHARPESDEEAARPDPWALWKNAHDVQLVNVLSSDALWSERQGTAPYYGENAFELLGRPGEWYFDRAARRIYYSPRAGEYLETADVEAAAAGALVLARGSRDRPLAGIIFKGIRFEYTTPHPESREPEGALVFEAAGEIQLLEDTFIHMGTPAVVLGPGVAGATLEGCFIGGTSGPALVVSDADRVHVTSSRFSYVAAERLEQPAIAVARATDVEIDHDQIDHYPREAVELADCPPKAVLESMNRIAEPMIGGGGRQAPAADGAGLPRDDLGLLDEAISAPANAHPPTEVAAEAEDGFAYVTWNPPVLDGGPPVTAFTVTCSSGPKMTVSAAEFQAKGYAQFEGLDNGAEVTFTVTATNDLGPSPPSLASAPIIPDRKRRLRPPPPPATVTASAGPWGGRVLLTPASSDGGSPIVAYTLSNPSTGARVVLEGRDVIHADAAHPFARDLEGFRPPAGSKVTITATNAAGEGRPAVVVWP